MNKNLKTSTKKQQGNSRLTELKKKKNRRNNPENRVMDVNLATSNSKVAIKVHIVFHDKQWAVKKEKAARAMRLLSSKADAVKFARNIAGITKVVVHSEDGSIEKNIMV